MKTYGGVEAKVIFINSVVDGGEWSASLSGHFSPGKDPM
jgi:hypothetical protein